MWRHPSQQTLGIKPKIQFCSVAVCLINHSFVQQYVFSSFFLFGWNFKETSGNFLPYWLLIMKNISNVKDCECEYVVCIRMLIWAGPVWSHTYLSEDSRREDSTEYTMWTTNGHNIQILFSFPLITWVQHSC